MTTLAVTDDGGTMTPDALLDYCLAQPGAFLDFPFGPDVAVVKVKAPSQDRGPIFLQVFELHGEPRATFRSDPDAAALWRDAFPGKVVPGYHCPAPQRRYASTVHLDGSVPDEVLVDMADDSWALMVAKLPRWARRELLGDDPSGPAAPSAPSGGPS